jgi:hypothetical protein
MVSGQNADISGLLESLKKIKPYSALPRATQSFQTQTQAAETNNRDYAINAMRQGPTLAENLKQINSGRSIPKNGTPGSLLFNNPITKTILGAVKVIDTPHKMMVSGVRELVDAFDGDPKTRASFNDWVNQVGKDDYGFGTAFPMTGWGGRIIGLAGDVLLDPLTWLRPFGAGAGKLAKLADGTPLKTAIGRTSVANQAGRLALADYAIRLGRSPEEVANIAFKGRIGGSPQFLKQSGLDKAGMYIAGTKIQLPYTGKLADAFSLGAWNVRSHFVQSKVGGALHRLVTTGDDYVKGLKVGLGSGALKGEAAKEAVQLLNIETRRRAVANIGRETLTRGIIDIINGPEYNEFGKTVFEIMDPKEPFRRAPKSAQETAYASKVSNVLQTAITDVKTKLKIVDPNAEIGEFIEYFPHMTAEAGLNYMSNPKNPFAESTFKFLKEDLFDKAGSFKTRKLKASTDGKANWFGTALTQEDIDKGVLRLNQLARDGGFVGDFFETDVKAVLSRYARFYGDQLGKITMADEIYKSGIGKMGKMASVLDNEMFEDFSTQVSEKGAEVSFNHGNLIDSINGAARDIRKLLGPEDKPLGAQVGREKFEQLVAQRPRLVSELKGISENLRRKKDLLDTQISQYESVFKLDDPDDPVKLMKSIFDKYANSSAQLEGLIRKVSEYVVELSDVSVTSELQDIRNVLFPLTKTGEVDLTALGKASGKQMTQSEIDSLVKGYMPKLMEAMVPLKELQNNLNNLTAEYELLDRQFKLTTMVGNEFAGVLQGIMSRSIHEGGTLVMKEGVPTYSNLPGELEDIAKLLAPSNSEGQILLGFQTDDKIGNFAIKFFESAEGKTIKSIIDPDDQLKNADLMKKGDVTRVDFNEFRNLLATANPSPSESLRLRRIIANYVVRDIAKYGGLEKLPIPLREKLDVMLAKVNTLNSFQQQVKTVIDTANASPNFSILYDSLSDKIDVIGTRFADRAARLAALTETSDTAKFVDDFMQIANTKSGRMSQVDLESLGNIASNANTPGVGLRNIQVYEDFFENFKNLFNTMESNDEFLTWEQFRAGFNSEVVERGLALNARETENGAYFANLAKEFDSEEISVSAVVDRLRKSIENAESTLKTRAPGKKGYVAPVAPDPSFTQAQQQLRQVTQKSREELNELKQTLKAVKDLEKQLKGLTKERQDLFKRAGVRKADFDHTIDSTSNWKFDVDGTSTQTSVGQIMLDTQDATISYYVHSEVGKFMRAATEKLSPLGIIPNEQFSLFAINQLGKQLGADANYAVQQMLKANDVMANIQGLIRNTDPKNQQNVFIKAIQDAFDSDDDSSFELLFGHLRQLLPNERQKVNAVNNLPASRALRAEIINDIVKKFETRNLTMIDGKLVDVNRSSGSSVAGRSPNYLGTETSIDDVYSNDPTIKNFGASFDPTVTPTSAGQRGGQGGTIRSTNDAMNRFLARKNNLPVGPTSQLEAADIPNQMASGVRQYDPYANARQFDDAADAIRQGFTLEDYEAQELAWGTKEANPLGSDAQRVAAMRSRLERVSITKIISENAESLGDDWAKKYSDRWDSIVTDFKLTLNKQKTPKVKKFSTQNVYGVQNAITIPRHFRRPFELDAQPRDIDKFFAYMFGGTHSIPGGDFSVTKVRGGKLVQAPAGTTYSKQISEQNAFIRSRIAATQKRSYQFSLMQDPLVNPKSALENPLNIALGPTGHATMLRMMADDIKSHLATIGETQERNVKLLTSKEQKLKIWYEKKYGPDVWRALTANSFNPDAKLVSIINDIKAGIPVPQKNIDVLAGNLPTEVSNFKTDFETLARLKNEIGALADEPLSKIAEQEEKFNKWLVDLAGLNGDEIVDEFGRPGWSYDTGGYVLNADFEKNTARGFVTNFNPDVPAENQVAFFNTEKVDIKVPVGNTPTIDSLSIDLNKLKSGQIIVYNADGEIIGQTVNIYGVPSTLQAPGEPGALLMQMTVSPSEIGPRVVGGKTYMFDANSMARDYEKLAGLDTGDFDGTIELGDDITTNINRALENGNATIIKVKERIKTGERLSPTNMHVKDIKNNRIKAIDPTGYHNPQIGGQNYGTSFTPTEWRSVFSELPPQEQKTLISLREQYRAARNRQQAIVQTVSGQLGQLEIKYGKKMLSGRAYTLEKAKLSKKLVQAQSMAVDLENNFQRVMTELRLPEIKKATIVKLREFYGGFDSAPKADEWIKNQTINGGKYQSKTIIASPVDAAARREVLGDIWDSSDYAQRIKEIKIRETKLNNQFLLSYPTISQHTDVLRYHDQLIEEAIRLEKAFAQSDLRTLSQLRNRFESQVSSATDFDFAAFDNNSNNSYLYEYNQIRKEAEETLAGAPEQMFANPNGGVTPLSWWSYEQLEKQFGAKEAFRIYSSSNSFTFNTLTDKFGGEAMVDNYVFAKLEQKYGKVKASKLMLQTEFDLAAGTAFSKYADDIASSAQTAIDRQFKSLQPFDFQFKAIYSESTGLEILDPLTKDVYLVKLGEELNAITAVRAAASANMDTTLARAKTLTPDMMFILDKMIKRLNPEYRAAWQNWYTSLKEMSQFADREIKAMPSAITQIGILDQPISLRVKPGKTIKKVTPKSAIRKPLSEETYTKLFGEATLSPVTASQQKYSDAMAANAAKKVLQQEKIDKTIAQIAALDVKFETNIGLSANIDSQIATLETGLKLLEETKNRVYALGDLKKNASQQEIETATEIIDDAKNLIARIRQESGISTNESIGFLPRQTRKVMLDLAKKQTAYAKSLMVEDDIAYAAEGIIADFGTDRLPTKEALQIFDNGYVQLSTSFPSIYVPQSVSEIFNNVHRLDDPAIVATMRQALGGYNKFFKSYATLSPGFHVRNAYNNVFMHLAGGAGFKYVNESLDLIKAWERASSNKVSWESWVAELNPVQQQRVVIARDAVAASGDGMFDSINADLAFGGWITNNRALRASKRIGHWSDYVSRFVFAYDHAARGEDFLEVAAKVQKYFIDYSSKSNLDKVMTQIVPFWMFASRNLPLHIQNIYMNPKVYQMYRHIRQNFSENDKNKQDDAVPGWMREIGAWKLPVVGSWYATPDFGFQKVSTDIQRLQDPKRLLSDVTPILRLPIELAGDKKFFTNKKFSEVPVETPEGTALAALQPLLQALGYGQTNAQGKKFVNDKAGYAALSAFPFLGTTERLSASSAMDVGEKSPNALMGFLGLPIKKNTPQMQLGELNSRKREMQNALAQYLAVNKPKE